jgi:hypothetical protein
MEWPANHLYCPVYEIAFITYFSTAHLCEPDFSRLHRHKEDHGSEKAARHAQPSCNRNCSGGITFWVAAPGIHHEVSASARASYRPSRARRKAGGTPEKKQAPDG